MEYRIMMQKIGFNVGKFYIQRYSERWQRWEYLSYSGLPYIKPQYYDDLESAKTACGMWLLDGDCLYEFKNENIVMKKSKYRVRKVYRNDGEPKYYIDIKKWWGWSEYDPLDGEIPNWLHTQEEAENIINTWLNKKTQIVFEA